MINIDSYLTSAQIAVALLIIAFAVFWKVFVQSR